MENRMTFNVFVKKEDELFVAHCLELDIVTSSNNIGDLESDIISLISAQLDYAIANDNLDNLFHPAPSEVWQELYECN